MSNITIQNKDKKFIMNRCLEAHPNTHACAPPPHTEKCPSFIHGIKHKIPRVIFQYVKV